MKKRDQKGVALLITMFAILIMTFLAVEIGYNSHVELKVGAAQVDRLRAYYLAKAGVELSLLRINVYKTVIAKFGAQIPNKSDLDMIWQFPFTWPPTVPEEAADIDKEQIKSAVKESTIEGSFATTIEGEDGKIDVTDLVSPSQALAKATNAQLVQILQNHISGDDEWAHDHQNLKPQEIVNNIADWMDTSNDSRNGGSKGNYYANTNPPIVPPNRPMKTIEELHMVSGVTDDIYNLLAPQLTVFGIKGVNVNYASSEVIRSIDHQITAEIAKDVIDRRSNAEKGGFFKDAADFTTFLQKSGVNIQTFNKNPEINLIFDSEINFRIKSSGVFGRAQREIIAIAYDFDTVKAELSTVLSQASPTASPGVTPPPVTQPGAPGAPTPTPTPTATPGTAAAPSGPPTIVFWQEI